MRRIVFSPAIVCLLSATVSAEPMSGTLVGTKDADVLNYECYPQSDGKLSCSFVQVLLSNNSDEAKLQESLLQIPEILSEPSDILESCKMFADLEERIEAVKSGTPVEGLSDEELDAAKGMLESGSANLFLEQLPKLEAFCASQTPATAEGMLRAFHEMSRTTCTPFVNRYEQTFVQVNENLWVVESSPSGDCGIVNISSFYLPFPDRAATLWNYRSQKTITNKTGKANGVMECSLLDETMTEYRWDSPAVQADCMFLD